MGVSPAGNRVTEFLDTPLTRLKAEYETKLLAKTVLLEDMQQRVENAQENLERVKGVNQMLRLLLADMAAGVSAIASQVDAMARNITELRCKLPDLD